MKYRVTKDCVSEIKVLGSRFFCLVTPINSIEEVSERIDSFKKEFSKADHYPYAYVFKDVSKSSDDGEPSGTAGRQFLELLKKEELENCLIVVARYFGGSKLGVGRLTRTFLESAKQSLEKCPRGVVKTFNRYEIEVDYPNYELLKKFSLKNNIILTSEKFDTSVKANILVKDKEVILENKFNIKFLSLIEKGTEDIVEAL